MKELIITGIVCYAVGQISAVILIAVLSNKSQGSKPTDLEDLDDDHRDNYY